MTFTKACMEFFGKLPGEKTVDFANGMKALTDEDRLEMAPQLANELGETVTVKAGDGSETEFVPVLQVA